MGEIGNHLATHDGHLSDSDLTGLHTAVKNIQRTATEFSCWLCRFGKSPVSG